jgi:hypothetical protein
MNKKVMFFGALMGLGLLNAPGADAHGAIVSITTPNTATSYAQADENVTVTWVTYPACNDCGLPGGLNQSAELVWSVVENGNWIDPQTIQMSKTTTSGGTPCTERNAYTATIPGQSALKRVEFVVHSYGSQGDFWYKDIGFIQSGDCGGNPNQEGWPRGSNTNGTNFFYSTLETPYAVIDYPTENESIGPTYTIRLGSNASTNNMRVKIDTGDWSQAYYSSGYWWFDWANYGMGSHTIVAEGWNALGQRTESSVRNVTRTN